ncbi:Uncharacterised protein [Mycobacteroides abscessus subsp. abscessus]|nr:Uncharacterised protein [Mycobacteroides abscessus subsp. abscessus]
MQSLRISRNFSNGVPQFNNLSVIYAPQLAVRMPYSADASFGMSQNKLTLRNGAMNPVVDKTFAVLLDFAEKIHAILRTIGNIGRVLKESIVLGVINKT